MMGVTVADDIALVPCNHLTGVFLSCVYSQPHYRHAWLAAECAAARHTVQEIALQESLWLEAAAPALGSLDSEGDRLLSAVLHRLQAAFGQLFQRCLWLGSLEARLVAVETVLGSAVDVCFLLLSTL
jgi:hypothetical protein